MALGDEMAAQVAALLGQSSAPINVCEVNLKGLELALALLCRFANATYTGFDVSNCTTAFEAATFMRQQHPRVSIFRGAPVRSALATKLQKVELLRAWTSLELPSKDRAYAGRAHPSRGNLLGSCDLLVANMRDETPAWREALVQELPHVLSLPRNGVGTSAGGLVVLYGHACGGRTWRRRAGIYRGPQWGEYREQCWRTAWDELVQRGDVVRGRCGVVNGAVWCAGRLNPSSLCSRTQPLLQPAGKTLPRDSARESVQQQGETRLVQQGPLGVGVGRDRDGRDRVLITRLRIGEKVRSAAWKGEFAYKLHREFRYFSLTSCVSPGGGGGGSNGNGSDGGSDGGGTATTTGGGLCLLFKNGVFETWVASLFSIDGIRFGGEPRLVVPSYEVRLKRQWPLRSAARMTHNYAVLRHSQGFIVIGGTHNREGDGIWALRGGSLLWSLQPTELVPKYSGRGRFKALSLPTGTQWKSLHRLLNGTHAGCVERRDRARMPWVVDGVCEYDGRLSLVYHEADHDEHGLPDQFNAAHGLGHKGYRPAEDKREDKREDKLDKAVSGRRGGTKGGGRGGSGGGGFFLLYARANLASHGSRFVQVTRSADLVEWTPFQPIRVNGYAPTQGDIYFFAVQTNPIHRGSLLALFPLVHRLRACIAISLSVDGVTWSSPTPLRRCPLVGQRASDHPIAGGVVYSPRVDTSTQAANASGSVVHFYLQHRVPGISQDKLTPVELWHWRRKTERPSAFLRHTISCSVFARWTLRQLGSNFSRDSSRSTLRPQLDAKCDR